MLVIFRKNRDLFSPSTDVIKKQKIQKDTLPLLPNGSLFQKLFI